mgnify:FL=1
MKKIYVLLFTLTLTGLSFGQTVFINELHYDNSSSDIDEGVEIAGPAGTDLTSYKITAYNGSNGLKYLEKSLSGIIPNIDNSGYGTLFFPTEGLQNGAPDGIALDDGTSLIQFLSYEGVMTATDGVAKDVASTDIVIEETGSTPVGHSIQLTGSGTEYENFSWTGPIANTNNLINTGQTFGVASPTLIISSPSDGETIAPSVENVNIEWTTTNTSGTETVNIIVNGTTTNDVTSPFAISTTDGSTYNVTVNLIDGGSTVAYGNISFSIGNLTQVASITALRSDVTANGADGFYEITGQSLLTHKDGYKGKKWFQDATPSGIYIYDAEDVIATTYNVGDMVSGLKGKAVIVNGVLQLHPTEDSGVIASSDNAVVAQTVTIAGFNAAPSDYESTFINFENVKFSAGDGAAVFETGENYVLTQGQAETVVRTEFYGADYIGENIPSTELANVSGIAGAYNGTAQLYVRNLADLTTTLAAGQFEVSKFNLYPNPTKSDFVNITSTGSGAMQAAIFDILGKQVINTTVSNKRINISTLNTGIYIVKLTQGAATTTKKLIVQ